MHLEHVRRHFEKRHQTTSTLPPGATPIELKQLEQRIGLELPMQVRAFYSYANGLRVEDPEFEILAIERLILDSNQIHFATANSQHRISFDCSEVNQADQWTIVESATGAHITFSMASFWSNKMWKWIDDRREFWRGDV